MQGKAADALRSIGKATIPFLLKEYENAFLSKDYRKAILIISAIGRMGKDANEAIPMLCNVLKSKGNYLKESKRGS